MIQPRLLGLKTRLHFIAASLVRRHCFLPYRNYVPCVICYECTSVKTSVKCHRSEPVFHGAFLNLINREVAIGLCLRDVFVGQIVMQFVDVICYVGERLFWQQCGLGNSKDYPFLRRETANPYWIVDFQHGGGMPELQDEKAARA